MTVLFMFVDDGGLLAGSTEAGRASYAYPTSGYADRAKKKPAVVAREMVQADEYRPTEGKIATQIAERDSRWMDKLKKEGTEA